MLTINLWASPIRVTRHGVTGERPRQLSSSVSQGSGSNLLGVRKTATSSYYICGSQPHRKGLGCGTAVYVPQRQIETEVMAGLTSLMDVCTDPKGCTRQVNEELKRIWEDSVGYDPAVPGRLREIDTKIANICKAVEDGLPDAEWAWSRMRELTAESDSLSHQENVIGEAPRIDVTTALAYRAMTEKVMKSGSNAERKRMLRSCVDKITLAPDTLEVEITYKIPEAVGAYSGSGDPLHGYTQRTCRLAR